AAVHVGATAALVDEDETRRIVTLLTDAFERGRPDPWSIEEADEDYIFTQLQGIVGVHFTATAVDAKFKLSQNRTAEDRSGALNGLRATGHESDRQLAELMDHMSKPPLTV
ncbi:MAG: FMN-binding negative transcriptional regulator, partial [Candidatus Baltobacteraceae bacterium]